MGNRCNNCEWWDAPGKRETGYCLKQKQGQRVTQKDFCCPHFSEGLWQDRWNPESIARRAKQEKINQIQEANKMFYEVEINDNVQGMIVEPVEIPEREIPEDFDI